MDEKVRVQPSLDQRDRNGSGDFAALFAQLDRPDAVAPIEGGLMRMLCSMHVVKQGARKR